MKKIRTLFALAAIFLALVSCSQEETVSVGNDDVTANKYLVGLTSTEVLNHDEVNDLVTRGIREFDNQDYNEYLDGTYLEDDFYTFPKNLLLQEDKQFIVRHFTYNTVDINGNPKVLSGSIGYVQRTRKGETKKIEGIELSINGFALGQANRELLNLTTYLRARYNILQITPDRQGRGYDNDSYFPIAQPYLAARQAIDCEMAALELVRNLELELVNDYTTTINAISQGGPTALAIQQMLETSEPAQVTEKLRLSRNNLRVPTTDFWRVAETVLTSNPIQMDEYIVPALLQFVIDAKNSHPDIMADYEIEDYFKPEFNEQRIEVEGESYSWVELVNKNMADEDTLPMNYGFVTAHDALKEDSYNEDGSINLQNPRIAALKAAIDASALTYDWTPKHPIYFMHSTRDDVMPYEDIYNLCKDLHTKAPGMVYLKTFHAKGHYWATMVSILETLKRYPIAK